MLKKLKFLNIKEEEFKQFIIRMAENITDVHMNIIMQLLSNLNKLLGIFLRNKKILWRFFFISFDFCFIWSQIITISWIN